MDKAEFKRMLLEALNDPDVLAALQPIVLDTPVPERARGAAQDGGAGAAPQA
jgi:hypothetical protein